VSGRKSGVKEVGCFGYKYLYNNMLGINTGTITRINAYRIALGAEVTVLTNFWKVHKNGGEDGNSY
jgi:hypothetical protein